MTRKILITGVIAALAIAVCAPTTSFNACAITHGGFSNWRDRTETDSRLRSYCREQSHWGLPAPLAVLFPKAKPTAKLGTKLPPLPPGFTLDEVKP